MTDKAQHTPGPWQADDFLCEGDHALRIGMPHRNGMPTATIAFCEHNWNDCGQYDRRISWKEAEANARLIASAPELLEAAEAALNYIVNTEGELGIALDSGDKLRAVIAKATSQ